MAEPGFASGAPEAAAPATGAASSPAGGARGAAPLAVGAGAPAGSGGAMTSGRAGGAASSDAPADIRDIRGPIAIPYPWLLPLVIAAGALGVGLLAWLGARWWKRRRARPAPRRSPEDIAFERLAAAERLLAPGREREFGGAVSDAVRLYIEDRLERRAARQTTEELLREVVRDPRSPLAPDRELLADFLAHCDLAKFARQPLSLDEMRAMHASARRFVESVRDRSTASAGASGGAAARAAS